VNLEQQLQFLDPAELGQRLADARKRRSLTQQDAATVLDVSRTTIVAMEKGTRRVTADELLRLAELFDAELSDLLRSELADVNLSVQFRKLLEAEPLFEPDKRSALDEAIDELQRHAVQYVELERLLGRSTRPRFGRPYPLKGVGDLEGYAEEAAQEERRRLNLGDGPVANLQEVLEESVGLRVFQFPMKGKVSGLYGYAPQLGACVAINSDHPRERRIHTLAHEYGHVVSDPTNYNIQVGVLGRSNSRAERFSTAFGIALTMPEAGIKRQLREYTQHRNDTELTLGDLVYLASRFHVSFEAYVRRLEDLRLLPKGTGESLKSTKFSVRSAQRQIGVFDEANDARPPRVPDRFALLAVEAYGRELVTREQLRQMLHVNDEQLQPVINRYSMVAMQQEGGGIHQVPIELLQQIPLRVK
jgi:Zn-dependent peptidase ImmA (M78 family)/transcriptional regulator with XRE-family HTH domain